MEDTAGIRSESCQAAWTLVQMNERAIDSGTANHLEELISKNNQMCITPEVEASSFPIESLEEESLEELIDKNDQIYITPKVQTSSFPIESLRHLVGRFSSCLMKVLTNSDTRQNQMRLMFPKSFVEKDINPLLKDDESPKVGISTTLYFMHPKAEQYRSFDMLYKCWGEDKTYVLTSGWLAFVKVCNIIVGDKIMLWVFRHSQTGNLCFAITLSLPDDQ